jgi:hypothetical protein
MAWLGKKMAWGTSYIAWGDMQMNFFLHTKSLFGIAFEWSKSIFNT